MKHRIAAFIALATLVGSAHAVAYDGVVVATGGGSEFVREFDVERTGETESVVDRGGRRVLPTGIGPQIINDIKVLPDGSHLIAGGDDLGLIVTDERGEELLRLSRQASYGAVASASVGSYFSGAQPSRVILASDTVSAAFARQLSSERLLFFDSTRLGETRGRHAEAIVLPGNALGIAANYPASGGSTLDVLSTETGAVERIRFTNIDSVSHPAETTIDPLFTDIRDVHGFGPDESTDLLVVTRTQAFRLGRDGTRAWTVDLGTFGIGGEFASGVVLPGGRIALATFEPGRWVDPHPNHRVVWLEPDGTYSGLMSGVLPAAPVAIDASQGHGGTGTTGFSAGLSDIALGDPADLELAGPIFVDKPRVRLGDRVTTSASVRYPGPNAVSLGRLRLVGAPAADAGCEGVDVPVVDFVRDESVTILSQENYPLAAARSIDAVFEFGTWCVWVEVSDTSGRLFRLGDYASFEVVQQGGDAGGEPVPSDPLGFGRPMADAGTDAGGDAGSPTSGDDGGGCGCAATPGVDGSVLLLLLALVAGRRRR